MSSDNLNAIIREKFRHGKRRSEIKEALINQGYDEGDINSAIRTIQHDALRQLPGISSMYQIIEEFEAKSELATTKMTIFFMILCVGFLILLSVILYFVFNPFDTR